MGLVDAEPAAWAGPLCSVCGWPGWDDQLCSECRLLNKLEDPDGVVDDPEELIESIPGWLYEIIRLRRELGRMRLDNVPPRLK